MENLVVLIFREIRPDGTLRIGASMVYASLLAVNQAMRLMNIVKG